jgi:hypothetical protein
VQGILGLNIRTMYADNSGLCTVHFDSWYILRSVSSCGFDWDRHYANTHLATVPMRMALCWPSLLLLLANILSIHATTVNYNLTSEITNFIPSCAQECFKSFLEINFPSTPCSTTPTLNCLCSHNSTSGYTIGEGAVQCIISEDNIGFCQGNDAKGILLI